MELINIYEQKFNGAVAIQADQSWDRNISAGGVGRRRFDYAVSQLYGDVLDVGAADGYGAYVMTKNPDIRSITGIEIHDKSIERARENLRGMGVNIVRGIGEEMPFGAGQFDCVHCGQTLEHVEDDKKVLQEIHRVVKDIVVLSVPIAGSISTIHVRSYKTLEDFLALVGEHFDVTCVKEWQTRNQIGTPKKTVIVTGKKIT